MNMLDYYKQAFSRITDFKGRSSRSEFWYFNLMNMIVMFVLAGLAGAMMGDLNDGFPLMAKILLGVFVLYYLAILLPSLSISIRRLHDIGKSGWMFLLNFIPGIGGIILLVFWCLESQPKTNKWGPVPGTTNNDSLQDALVDFGDDIV